MSSQFVVIQGRVAKDPEIKQAGETTIANFSVPVDYRVKGEKRTQWFNCVAFNKTAEVISEYFTKGKPIIVQGELQTDEFEGKKYIKLIANRIQFVDSDSSAPRDEDGDDGIDAGTERNTRTTARPAAKAVVRPAAKQALRRAAATEDNDDQGGGPPWSE